MQRQKTLPSIPSRTSLPSLPAQHAAGSLALLTGTEHLPLLAKLEAWQISETHPGTAVELSTVFAALERGLASAAAHQYQQAEADLRAWMKGFGMQSAAPETVLATYHRTLASLPGDLLELAVGRIITTWKWGQRPPLPADILKTVESELGRRRRLMVRAQLAYRRAIRSEKMATRSNSRNSSNALITSQPYRPEPRPMTTPEPEESLDEFEARKKRMIAEFFPG